MSKTATNTSAGAQHQKPIISAKDFSELRNDFLAKRLIQYQERSKMHWNEIDDLVNSKLGGSAIIDELVDDDLKIKNCPDPVNYLFK